MDQLGAEVINELVAPHVWGNFIDEVLTTRRMTTPSVYVDYWYHQDDLFNVTAITDSGANLLEYYEYGNYGAPTVLNPSGMELPNGSAHANVNLWNGREFDLETRLYYYRTRYLEPTMGRFTTRDVIGVSGDALNVENGLNYVGSSPWTRRDPFGLLDLEAELDTLRRTTQSAFSCLSSTDRDDLRLFVDTQDCILQSLPSCASACGSASRDTTSRWIQNVTKDFMSPLIYAMAARCINAPIFNPGWRAFFEDLDTGTFEGVSLWSSAPRHIAKILAVYIGNGTDRTGGSASQIGQAIYSLNDFDDIPELNIAREMAMTHINHDLRRALMMNGGGADVVWKCIGRVIQRCESKIFPWYAEFGAGIAKQHFPDLYDVGQIRDQMHNEVACSQECE